MTVNVLTDEQRPPFEAASAEVEQEFIDMTGDSGEAILDQMKQDLDTVQTGS